MGYKVFTAGEEALATDVNSLLMSQTVPRFTNATQRTTQLVGPVVNQLSMTDDRPGVIQYWTGTAWLDLLGPWTSYSPTLTRDTGEWPTIRNGSLLGRYIRHGHKLVTVRLKLSVGSTTSANAGVARLGVPVPIDTSAFTSSLGSALLTSVGGVVYVGQIRTQDANTVVVYGPKGTSAAVGQYLATDLPSGGAVDTTFTYEATS